MRCGDVAADRAGSRRRALRAVAILTLLLGVGCAEQAPPLPPYEPITADDIELPPEDRLRPGDIRDIPLEREVEPSTEMPELPEGYHPGPGWVFEKGVERRRGTYRVLGGADLTSRACLAECAKDPMCKGFTYKEALSRGQSRVCDLKHDLRDSMSCPRCTTGLKP